MTSSTDLEVEPAQELLKLDSRGRIQISSERRTALLDEFDRSGMTGAGFARHYGIKYTTFAHWIRMRKKAAQQQQHANPGTGEKFLLVTNREPTSSPGLTVDLPHGAKVNIATTAEAELVGALIRSLGTGN